MKVNTKNVIKMLVLAEFLKDVHHLLPVNLATPVLSAMPAVLREKISI
jgi:hypothetical protein